MLGIHNFGKEKHWIRKTSWTILQELAKKISIEANSYNGALHCEVAEGSWQSIKDPIDIAAYFEVRVCSSG